MVKRAFKGLGLLFLLSLLAVAGAILWAQSRTLPDQAYAVLTAYESSEPAARDTFSVMTYNVGYLSGMTNNRPLKRKQALFEKNMDATIALMEAYAPDIVGLQEVDFDADRSFNVHQLHTLGERGGYAFGLEAVNWDVRYLPFPSNDPTYHFGMIRSGQGVLSRYPVVRHERVVLAPTSRPFWNNAFYLDRLAQVAEVQLGTDTLIVINVHLEAFEEATREIQAEQVRSLVTSYIGTDVTNPPERPLLLIGDFNSIPLAALDYVSRDEAMAFAGDNTFSTLLRDLPLQSAYPDSVYARAGGAPMTFPADHPTRPIDHIYYTPAHIERVSTTVLDPPGPPSDHRPVYMRFLLK